MFLTVSFSEVAVAFVVLIKMTNRDLKGRFVKGMIPHNKGKRFVHSGSFKKSHKINEGKHWKVSKEKRQNMGVKKGVHNSPQTEFNKGYHNSPKTEFNKGCIPWNKRYNEEQIINLYKENKNVDAISEIVKCNIGTVYDILNRNKVKIRPRLSGEKSWSWKGGKSFEPYDKSFNNKFKRAIRRRDNQICMICVIHREKLNRNLDVHHINYDKLLSIPQNCITLCKCCHIKTNFNREQWTPFFQSLLSERYGYEYLNKNAIIEISGGSICTG